MTPKQQKPEKDVAVVASDIRAMHDFYMAMRDQPSHVRDAALEWIEARFSADDLAKKIDHA